MTSTNRQQKTKKQRKNKTVFPVSQTRICEEAQTPCQEEHRAMIRLSLLPGICLGTLLVSPDVVQGQRIKQGCLDSQPFSCNDPPPPPGSDEASTVDVEAVCTQLAIDIFPDQNIFLDVSLHEPYLNGIEPDSELCAQTRVAYSSCLFCYDTDIDPGLPELCYLEAVWTRCGDQPTLEQILAENRTAAYVPFVTEQDVYDTCASLEASYDVITLKDAQMGIPTTIDLCRRQNAIKHLCPGYCEGGCFDGVTGTQPSCDSYTGPRDEELKEYEICYILDYDHLFWLRPQGTEIWNISRHADYLRGIPGNTTECQNAQQSYNQVRIDIDKKSLSMRQFFLTRCFFLSIGSVFGAMKNGVSMSLHLPLATHLKIRK
jgi:hypothetical protein